MDWSNILMILVSSISLIITICNIIFERFFNSKNQYIKMKIDNKNIQIAFNTNKDTILEELKNIIESKELNKNLAITIINEYTVKLSNALTDFYPKNTFDISVKRLDEKSNTLYSIGENNSLKKSTAYKVEENTEFNAILNEHYRYFFVSDIDKFDELIMPYKNSNDNWNSLYKSSITVPIAKKQNSIYHIIGFICITSPQSLNNTKKNKKIINLLESTSNELYEILSKIS
ncbi:MAG: hypothetical protein HDT40_09305 [Lachnospiraceae bacterium]|nr:hypothetical protein [Lachnospiraceae bacterium]